MSDKKHIDRLFQEKLKDFEARPNDEIWSSIEYKLHQKKHKRRVIPLWWQMAGIAALLALLLTVGNFVFKDASENNSTNNPVVNTDDKDNIANPTSETNTVSNNNQDEKVAADNEGNITPESTTNAIVSQVQGNSTAIANTKTNADKGKNTQKANTINQALTKSENNVTIALNTKVDDAKNSSNLPEPNRNNIDDTQVKNKSEDLINNAENNTKTTVADIHNEDDISELNEANSEKNSQSIEDAVAQVNNTDEKDEDEKLSRWNVSTNVAPVYFNSIGNGSSLDDQFVGSSKSGEINMSYGINGSFAINEKLKIRAGINKVSLGYNINDVNIRGGGATLSALSRNKNNNEISNQAGITPPLSTQNLSYKIVPDLLASNFYVTLNQELGFIEFPIEIEYSILNKKLGLNVISGISTFLLDNNKVYSSLNGEKALLGEAQNINNTSYSANFGLGLNYNVSDKIKINLEPTFKYQINTFRNTSGDFNPYIIGVYTGLSYKF